MAILLGSNRSYFAWNKKLKQVHIYGIYEATKPKSIICRNYRFDFLRNLPRHFENTIQNRKFTWLQFTNSRRITTIAMTEEKQKVNTGLEEQEKVTNMVGTFLNEDIEGFQKISVATTQPNP